MNIYNKKTIIALLVLLFVLTLSTAGAVWYSAYLLWSINKICAVLVVLTGNSGIARWSKKVLNFLFARLDAIDRITQA